MVQAQHLVTAINKCVDCHGEDFGGTDDGSRARGKIPGEQSD
jgi:hypothetical protein